MSYLRKLFWGAISSGVLMVFSGFSNAPQKLVDTVKTLKEIQKTAEKNKQAIDGRFNTSGEVVDPLEVPRADGRSRRMAAVKEVPEIKYEEKHEIYNDEKFVLINGKYYEYRADHIYMVNGVKTYFVDNKKIITTKDVKDTESGLDRIPAQALNAYEKARAKVSADGGAGILSAEDALKKLQDLQGMTEARDNYLDTLRSDGQ